MWEHIQTLKANGLVCNLKLGLSHPKHKDNSGTQVILNRLAILVIPVTMAMHIHRGCRQPHRLLVMVYIPLIQYRNLRLKVLALFMLCGNHFIRLISVLLSL